MTYCIGILLDEGLVFLSDSRTNAGMDQINTFRKMTFWDVPADRVLVLLTAGNLAIGQGIVNVLKAKISPDKSAPHLLNVTSLFDAATLVGEAVREVHHRDAESLKEFGVEFNPTLILGGQIAGESPRLFTIYSAGNFIEATRDTPYFQIGEAKYGKPILDRVIRSGVGLDEAAKCALISMDSTIRSNLSVGLPLDLLYYRKDALQVQQHVSIDQHNLYFEMIRSRWGEQLRRVFQELPNPQW
ncbi:MAG: proteasome-type protease [Ferrovum sp.]|nr:proteasome-type protease [Ferrovum sp.]